MALSHYNIICNVVQAATFNRINEAYTSWEDRRFRPGDICTAGTQLYGICYTLVDSILVLPLSRELNTNCLVAETDEMQTYMVS